MIRRFASSCFISGRVGANDYESVLSNERRRPQLTYSNNVRTSPLRCRQEINKFSKLERSIEPFPDGRVSLEDLSARNEHDPASGLGGKGRRGRAGATETSADNAALFGRRSFPVIVPNPELADPPLSRPSAVEKRSVPARCRTAPNACATSGSDHLRRHQAAAETLSMWNAFALISHSPSRK